MSPYFSPTFYPHFYPFPDGVPFFLADAGDGEQFFDTFEAVILFPEIDNPFGEGRADSGQRPEFLD